MQIPIGDKFVVIPDNLKPGRWRVAKVYRNGAKVPYHETYDSLKAAAQAIPEYALKEQAFAEVVAERDRAKHEQAE